ncbi:MAG: hypothetical protein JJLCMIEE_00421 [Acidimicrobiales bacterium]|nr:MAG: helix-turn-helix domain-containing protein [Actinomycetota bacterium]MBV6507376.1 hypothetical protein [Acidimicrobiales bacterium]RIK04502.1 MAG: transcriptional regulator [Acidobacteriota bacterium]
MDVALLRWPSEQPRRAQLSHAGLPRLLVVEPEAAPPLSADELEDWVRVPIDEVDFEARVAGLRRRYDTHLTRSAAAASGVDLCPGPVLDADGVLRLGAGWVCLPPVEARLAAALLDRLGVVVSREALSRAGWPGKVPARNSLDVHVLRLRRRISPLSLVIHTVRSRGYVLEVSDPSCP